MFLDSQRGYTSDGQQWARGRFLMLFSHNQYKWEDENNLPLGDRYGEWIQVDAGESFLLLRQCSCRAGNHLSMKLCAVHGYKFNWMPKDLRRKLYASVRYVSLRQCGHFMMGCARIAGQSVTVSGSYGDDGLPMDYEDLTTAARRKLIEVPSALADIYWGECVHNHNEAGREAPMLVEWALAVFEKRERKR